MTKYIKTPELKQKIEQAIANNDTMAKAAKEANIPFTSFKRLAEHYELYSPNQGGKGTSKISGILTPIDDILQGKYPGYQSDKLRKRLLADGYKEHKCESCEHTEWLGVPIPLELEHIDGNPTNHMWDNIELLCPNCHALTETYRGKNIGKNR